MATWDDVRRIATDLPEVAAKEGVLDDAPGTCFATPHFGGYPVVLVRLEPVTAGAVDELVVGAWLARAPKRVAAAYLGRPG
jgi:hypothetical protein